MPRWNRGWLEPSRLRHTLASLPLPRAADGRIVLAVDVSNWLRPHASTSDDRLFCHVYGPGDRKTDQFVPGRPYSFVAALETAPGLLGRVAERRAPRAGGRRDRRHRCPMLVVGVDETIQDPPHHLRIRLVDRLA